MDQGTSIILKKNITWMHGVALTIGAVLGSGVLVLPVLAAKIAGPASIVSWVIMGLLTIPLVLAFSELGSHWPEAGGIAAYANHAFGRTASVVTGWLYLGTVPIGAPIAALIGASYIGSYFSSTPLEITLIAGMMLAMALMFNYRGIHLSSRVQMVIVALIGIILIIVILSALPDVDKQFFTPFTPNGWGPVGVAMTVLFWAFVGWEMIGHLAEEFENPARDFALCMGISLFVINILYVMLSFVVVGTGAYLGQDNVAALAAIAYKSAGPSTGAIIAVLGFIACYGSIHTYVAGFSRLVYAQARQGYFPSYFSKLHSAYQTPHRVLLALIPIFSFGLLSIFYFQLDLEVIIQFPSAIFIALYIIGMGSAAKLLPPGIGRGSAILSLIVCIMIFGFTGWSGLYPFLLAAFGWYAAKRKKAGS